MFIPLKLSEVLTYAGAVAIGALVVVAAETVPTETTAVITEDAKTSFKIFFFTFSPSPI
jgi:hypothetical protein